MMFIQNAHKEIKGKKKKEVRVKAGSINRCCRGSRRNHVPGKILGFPPNLHKSLVAIITVEFPHTTEILLEEFPPIISKSGISCRTHSYGVTPLVYRPCVKIV